MTAMTTTTAATSLILIGATCAAIVTAGFGALSGVPLGVAVGRAGVEVGVALGRGARGLCTNSGIPRSYQLG